MEKYQSDHLNFYTKNVAENNGKFHFLLYYLHIVQAMFSLSDYFKSVTYG